MTKLRVGRKNTVGAVQSAVNDQLGYKANSRKGKLSNRITALSLDWYVQKAKTGLPSYNWNKSCEQYVRDNLDTTPPTFIIPTFVWGWVINYLISAIVPFLVEWLMSQDSQEWRVSNAG